MGGNLGGTAAKVWGIGGIARGAPRPMVPPRGHRPMAEVLARQAAADAAAKKTAAVLSKGGKFSFGIDTVGPVGARKKSAPP